MSAIVCVEDDEAFDGSEILDDFALKWKTGKCLFFFFVIGFGNKSLFPAYEVFAFAAVSLMFEDDVADGSDLFDKFPIENVLFVVEMAEQSDRFSLTLGELLEDKRGEDEIVALICSD